MYIQQKFLKLCRFGGIGLSKMVFKKIQIFKKLIKK